MNLNNYDLIIINSSAGKDSLCAIWEVCRLAKEQNFDFSKIIVSHQCLGRMEWEGTKELAKKQAELFGLKIEYSKRVDNKGKEETLLEYALRRGKWPSSKQRWCTSDYKRGPGAKVVTMLTKNQICNVLYVFGFRAEESPSRRKKDVVKVNNKLTTNKRLVKEWLPIHHWTMTDVWCCIKENQLPYHFAYDLGMPRLSCVFCIFSPFDALVIAGINNPKLLQEYIDVEEKINHTFNINFSLKSVQEKIESGYVPEKISDWTM